MSLLSQKHDMLLQPLQEVHHFLVKKYKQYLIPAIAQSFQVMTKSGVTGLVSPIIAAAQDPKHHQKLAFGLHHLSRHRGLNPQHM